MPSPMMSQYIDLKNQHPNELLFFRLGDFYEMFGEDAKIGSKEMDLVLTKRKNKTDGEIPMCGIPFHSAEGYIAKLIKKGFSVAICEQMETAGLGKDLVQRDVIRVITPGTAMLSESMLEPQAVYVGALSVSKNQVAFAMADVSTGKLSADVLDFAQMIDVFGTENIKEIVISEKQKADTNVGKLLSKANNVKVVVESDWNFRTQPGYELVTKTLGVKTLDGFGFDKEDVAVGVAGALLHYLIYTQHSDLKHFAKVSHIKKEHHLILDGTTIANLEIFSNFGNNRKSAMTLWSVIKKTHTAMGTRMLANWLTKPLLDISKIAKRQDDVEILLEKSDLHNSLVESLVEIADIERILARVATHQATPKDLFALKASLKYVSKIKEILEKSQSVGLGKISEKIDRCDNLVDFLENALVESPPNLVREGGFVKRGFSQVVDELKDLTQGGQDWIKELEQTERKRTGINSLKIRFNKVFGYYIEISKANADKVPSEYIKKQTMVNGDRFITPEIKIFEEKILSAESKLLQEELKIFEELLEQVMQWVKPIKTNADLVGYIDCISSFALLAKSGGYTRPTLHQQMEIKIHEGRHPVVEKILAEGEFVSNDTFLDGKENLLVLLTGPNMAGKSTYIRQVALIVILAQMGSFVPAIKAEIGIVDRIFTRVGASDNMSEGQSTFMVEMSEVANILNNATRRSLVILDEVGRGTATYDGMSIAGAIVRYVHNRIGARTLFATHYHELLVLEEEFVGVVNYSVSAKDQQGDIVFLRKVQKGGSDKSYGIAIAKLAGFPKEVVKDAYDELDRLEQGRAKTVVQGSIFALGESKQPSTIPEQIKNPKDTHAEKIREKLENIDLNRTTPMEALQILADLQGKI
jgi:DNA mismatch repair protein MutS